MAIRLAPPGYDVDTHFNPPYDPWDQRVCLVPDADLFEALKRGRAEIVTDRIRMVTNDGVELESGGKIEADVIVTATGLNLLAVGGIEIEVDGEEIELSETVGYKGMMLSGVPNLVMTLGYTNASWTLKADLVSEYVCRLLGHMDRGGYDFACPQPPPPGVSIEPFLDLKAGYVQRSIDQLPKQGSRWPWKLHQNYLRDVIVIRHGSVTDEAMEFGRSGRQGGESRPSGRARIAPRS
jgi:cation diffusion facilitator CzcD-associated flavoprotein CzcO